MPNVSDVAAAYKRVIDSVIDRVRPHFVNMGVDEQVLAHLQSLWERKVMESGVFSSAVDVPAAPRMVPAAGGSQAIMLAIKPEDSSSGSRPHPGGEGIKGDGAGAGKEDAEVHGRRLEKRASQEVLAGHAAGSEKRLKVPRADDLGGDEEIGSDLDDDEEEDTDRLSKSKEADAADKNQIVCLFDKVQRVRNRWKCNFAAVVAHIDGRDYLFNKLNGDFEW